jgi:hypothetical protein
MFITSKKHRYTRDGQQFASGLFLILVQPKISDKYPFWEGNECIDCGRTREEHEASAAIHILQCAKHGIMARLKQRAANKIEPSDADFIEAPNMDCPDCKAHTNGITLAGCTNFRLRMATYPIRALVRHVSMSQCGHFMMGNARVHGERLTLSGSYGGDGLPDSVSANVYDVAVPLPEELYVAWKNGGGWNGAGSEAKAMREWALANLALLRA